MASQSEIEIHQSSFTLRKALYWTTFWIILSLLFCLGIYFYAGADAAFTWLSAYVVEKLLSFDNLFMFHVIFRFFGTSQADQRSALNWGIIGAILLRGSLFLGAIGAVAAAPWLLYGCGAFLLISGLKMLFSSNDEEEENAPTGMIDRLRNWFPSLSLFFITIATIELTDLLFALDSIPAAMGITTDLFLLGTSNLMAVLGLRSMYFVMQAAIEKWHFLDKGVSVILCGLGIKMLITPWVIVPTPASFAFIAAIMLVSVLLSAMKEYANKPVIENELPSITKKFCTFFFKPEPIEVIQQPEEEKSPCPSSPVLS